eukprot:TRINITY_DN17343_c0_g1_i1.p1 TRINITY_DN17343_c0_g1~~TRINITY_DN17343_c0_g1_i1.p1  ORF type:complete len:915 (-),score=83.24 TRINITY_DN17343_c0_g1_i1:171-2915(-)
MAFRSGAGFDPVSNMIGEESLDVEWPKALVPGEAVADAMGLAWSRDRVPVEVSVTNYRLKLVEPPCVCGAVTVHVKVCGGFNLNISGRSGKPDAYARLSLTGSEHRSLRYPKKTTVKRKSHNPVWNETFAFENVSDESCLHVELWEGKVTNDTFIGEAHVQNLLTTTAAHNFGRPRFLNLKIRDSIGNGEGSLRLCVRSEKTSPKPKFCSIPLLLIDCVSSSCVENEVRIATRLADELVICFDVPGAADAAFKAIMSHPAKLTDAFCFIAPGKQNAEFPWPAQSPMLGPASPVTFNIGTPLLTPQSVGSPAQNPNHVFCMRTELERWTTQKSTRFRKGSPTDYASRFIVNSDVNANFLVCKTYAEEVVLPASMTSDALKSSAAFRSKQRFPFAAWVHPSNGATLVRCGQPKTGWVFPNDSALKNDRECLLSFAPCGSKEVTICDARPYLSAQANSVCGGGTEYNWSGYAGFRVEFLDIDNIHEMRKCFAALRPGSSQADDQGTSVVAIGGWLNHLAALLRGACLVASILESGETVAVHCSHGWDRTPQIVSLASLLLDGHYRTIVGITHLIQKDWILPGHKFGVRNGLSSRKDQRDQYDASSPIFPQFMDCVAQIWRLYPSRFEYSLHLLSFILFHSFSGLYPNFFGDSEMQRRDRLKPDSVVCLWSDIIKDKRRWMNPVYDASTQTEPLSPSFISFRRLIFCEDLYSSLRTLWAESQPRDSLVQSSPTPLSRLSASPSECLTARQPSFDWALHAVNGHRSTPIFCINCEDVWGVGPAVIVENLLRRFTGVSQETSQTQAQVFLPEWVAVGSHFEFVIQLKFSTCNSGARPEREIYVTRRFSEFLVLKRMLSEVTGFHIDAPFPGKLGWGRLRRLVGLVRDSQFLEKRRALLEAWLHAVIDAAAGIELTDSSFI